MISPRKPRRSPCVVRDRKSKFIDIFRSTPAQTVCPNFYVLSHANGCIFQPQCDYCYLKSSLWHVKGQEAFANTDQLLAEVRRWIALDGLESYVLNTGNLSDSLVFEEVRPLIGQLIAVFREAEAAGRPHALLLVTKGGPRECRPLLEVEPCRNVIVSFSVNSPEVASEHERGAAPTAERLLAARQLKDAGWRLRIRIDPMFADRDYAATVAEVRALRPERVTLGCLRAEPHLLKMINHGLFDKLESAAEQGAMARYPLAARLAIYRPAVEALRQVCELGLCEETRDVWEALDLKPDDKLCNCGS